MSITYYLYVWLYLTKKLYKFKSNKPSVLFCFKLFNLIKIPVNYSNTLIYIYKTITTTLEPFKAKRLPMKKRIHVLYVNKTTTK